MNADTPHIRSEQRIIVTFVALIFGPLFMGGPVAMGVWMAIADRFSPLSLLMLTLCVASSAFFAYHMLQNYQWVELAGETIRGRRFWTRQYVERSLHDIDRIVPLGAIAKTTSTMVADQLLGPNRGYEIYFKNGGRTIGLIRGDMTNVQELADALSERLSVSSTTAP